MSKDIGRQSAHLRPKGQVADRARRWFGHLSKAQRIASIASGAVLVAGVAVLIGTLVVPGSPAASRQHHPSPTTPSSSVPARHKRHRAHLAGDDCPLTGTRAPGGKVPERPAIGVKIGNDPASRPQTGLLDADIVYEEMAEGGITRYLAVYQCHEAPVIGPIRSVRWDDWHVLQSFGHPILAFSGGIDQWNAVVASLSWLYDANASFYPMANAYYRTTTNVPPYNLYTSTASLWALDPTEHTAPPPQFLYRRDPAPNADSLSSATIVDFASGDSVVWTWDPTTRQWERSYGSQPDTDSSGVQLHASNVVIQMVQTEPGPYAESGDVPDTDSITEGTGVAYLLRNGKLERGTWTTPSYGDVMQLRQSDGKTMALSPGQTWVEMVPVTYAVQFQRAGS